MGISDVRRPTPIPWPKWTPGGRDREGAAPELVWLLEHPPLYTSGTAAGGTTCSIRAFRPFRAARRSAHLPRPRPRVGYVMTRFEAAAAGCAGLCRLAGRMDHPQLAPSTSAASAARNRVGVWVRRPDRGPAMEDKIAAIGVRLRRWGLVSRHRHQCRAGALAFRRDRACGVVDPRYGVTSLSISACRHHGRRRHPPPAGVWRSVRQHRARLPEATM